MYFQLQIEDSGQIMGLWGISRILQRWPIKELAHLMRVRLHIVLYWEQAWDCKNSLPKTSPTTRIFDKDPYADPSGAFLDLTDKDLPAGGGWMISTYVVRPDLVYGEWLTAEH
jgi:hypothetical protein